VRYACEGLLCVQGLRRAQPTCVPLVVDNRYYLKDVGSEERGSPNPSLGLATVRPETPSDDPISSGGAQSRPTKCTHAGTRVGA
jgi:hypothetical protein